MPHIKVTFFDCGANELCWSSTSLGNLADLRAAIVAEFEGATVRMDSNNQYYLVEVLVQDPRALEGKRYFVRLPKSGGEDHYLYQVENTEAGISLISKLARMRFVTLTHARIILLWLTCSEMGNRRIPQNKLAKAVDYFMECKNGEWEFLNDALWNKLRAAAGL